MTLDELHKLAMEYERKSAAAAAEYARSGEYDAARRERERLRNDEALIARGMLRDAVTADIMIALIEVAQASEALDPEEDGRRFRCDATFDQVQRYRAALLRLREKVGGAR